MAVPGTVLGGATVVAELSDGTVVSVVDTDESRPISRDSPKAAASAMTTMTPIRMYFLRALLRRCWRSSSASRAWRFAFCRSLLSVPTEAAGYRPGRPARQSPLASRVVAGRDGRGNEVIGRVGLATVWHPWP